MPVQTDYQSLINNVQPLVDKLTDQKYLFANAGSERTALDNYNHVGYAGLKDLGTQIGNTIAGLREGVQNGKVQLTDFNSVLSKLQSALNTTKSLWSQAPSQIGLAANGALRSTLGDSAWNANYIATDPKTGSINFKLPFKVDEYNKLPESVLPTQQDTLNGNWNQALAPIERYRSQPFPTNPALPTQPSPTPTPQPNPGVNPPNVPQITPVAGSGGNVPPSAPSTITSPSGGLGAGTSVGGIDESKLLAEAELEKQLRAQTLASQQASRQRMFDDLSTLLQQQNELNLQKQMPSIYEDLNTRGLLRSSALGEKTALEASNLQKATDLALAQKKLGYGDIDTQTYGDIENQYLTGRQQALQRRFSLEDFGRQIEAGKELGAIATPVAPSGNAKGGSALTGAIGGATVGGSVGGVPGALIGGTVGLVGGGAAGK